MSYVDLRPYKPKVKRKEPEVSSDTEGATGAATGDFFSSFADVGKQEQSTIAAKGDVIEILNLLNEKLSSVEEKLFRIERKL